MLIDAMLCFTAWSWLLILHTVDAMLCLIAWTWSLTCASCVDWLVCVVCLVSATAAVSQLCLLMPCFALLLGHGY
ncbi:hypothetical protein BDR26DRAFT_864123 [Obelidium mucronatum]|nr:hypothetical protein BDR26DRAFT_876490 [Obelidium mucronatum]KAI9337288.1 hypothetical protein BDR26DRAFT_864123 [Obelidium mucronatum]